MADHVFVATIVLYGFAFYNCYHILGARLSPGASISWIWANLTIPVLGVPLYWLIGGVRLKPYRLLVRPLRFKPENSDFDQSQFGARVQEFQTVFSTLDPDFCCTKNHVELLTDGSHTFEKIFEKIRRAEKYILVQYYIFRSDRLGNEFRDILLKKASEGVKICVLYDDMGSFWLSNAFIRSLKKASIKIISFNPITSYRRFFLANYRNHRKLVIVDGVVAFTGGLNVGEEYAGTRFKKKVFWRDAHLEIHGPALKILEKNFLNDWYFATSEDLREHISFHKAIGESKFGPHTNAIEAPIQVIPSGPSDPYNVGALLFSHLIRSAKKRLWVTSPFFIPDEALQRDLHLAVLRGVDVRILIPRESPKKLVHWVTLSYAEQMQSKGVRVLLYNKGFMHQKAILVDDSLSCIGTSNFDNRALYLNFELMINVHSPRFLKSLEENFKEDISNSSEFIATEERFIRRLIRLRANGARLLAPLL